MKAFVRSILLILIAFSFTSCGAETSKMPVLVSVPPNLSAAVPILPLSEEDSEGYIYSYIPADESAVYIYEIQNEYLETIEYKVKMDFEKQLGDKKVAQFTRYNDEIVLFSYVLIYSNDSIYYLQASFDTLEEITITALEQAKKDTAYYTILKTPLNEPHQWEDSYVIPYTDVSGEELIMARWAVSEIVNPVVQLETISGKWDALEVRGYGEEGFSLKSYYIPNIGLVRSDTFDQQDTMTDSDVLVRIEHFNGYIEDQYYETLEVFPSRLEDRKVAKAGDSKEVILNFLTEINPEISEMDILFYETLDMDNDGCMETVAAFGIASKNEYNDDWIMESFVVRNDNGVIELINQGFANSGAYGYYKVELVQFMDIAEYFIAAGITNGFSMYGIEILEFSHDGKSLESIAYNASAVGAGVAYLWDEDNGGKYDGYIVERYSYDVFYYPVKAYYRYSPEGFNLVRVEADVGEYPATVGDTVKQYISLCNISLFFPSEDIENRLSELSQADFRLDTNNIYGNWYMFLLELEPGITLDINEFENGAAAALSYKDIDTGTVQTVIFELVLSNERWEIISINEL